MAFKLQVSDLNREYDEIMKHNFDLAKFFAFTFQSRNYQGIRFRANLTQATNTSALPNTASAYCGFYYQNEVFKMVNKLKTTGDVKVGFGFNLNKYVKNLESKIKIRTNYHLDEFDGKVRFFLTKNKYNVKSTLDWSANKCLSASIRGLLLSRAQEELGVGAGISFALEEKQFSLYNAIAWYRSGDAKVILSHKTAKNKFQPGEVTVRVYNKVDDKTDVVFSASHDFPTREEKMSVGVRNKHSDTLTSKLKVEI